MGFWQAVVFAKKYQPHDPFHPVGEAAVFHKAVAEKLVDLGINPRGLGLFTGLGTPLDRLGADGFFLLGDIIVTIDVTKNPHKDCTRSRVLVTGRDIVDGFPVSSHEVAYWIQKATLHRAEKLAKQQAANRTAPGKPRQGYIPGSRRWFNR